MMSELVIHCKVLDEVIDFKFIQEECANDCGNKNCMKSKLHVRWEWDLKCFSVWTTSYVSLDFWSMKLNAWHHHLSSVASELGSAMLAMFVVSKETRWVFRGPLEETAGTGDRKRDQCSFALWQRDPVQTLFCRLSHEVQLVRKTALHSKTQYLSVLTVLEEIVCTHEKDMHIRGVWRYSCLTRDPWYISVFVSW